MWYWRQTDWNEYTVIGPEGERKVFKDFAEMYLWCRRRGIEAYQV